MKTFLETIKKNELKYTGFLTFYSIAVIIVSLCGILITKLTGDISQAALELDIDVILRFIGVMALVTGIKAIFSALSAFYTGRFSGKAGYKLRENFARHFAYIPFSDIEKKNSGSMLSLYANDLPQAASFVTDGSLSLISEIIYVIIIFIYMATINPFYTLIFFLTFPFLIFIQVKISTPIQKKAITISVEKSKFNAIVNDSLQNTATIIAYSLEDVMEERYLSSYDRYCNAMRDYINSLLKLVMSGLIATQLPKMFIYAAAGLSVIDKKMSISEFIAFTAVADIAGSWLSMLSQRLRTIRVNAASADRVNSNTSEHKEDILTGADRAGDNGTVVKFDNVSFSYTDGVQTLDSVSFEIKKGEKTAIVGSSGSGKSTVLKLLLALYSPSGGDIYISGSNINKLSKSALRSHLAYVPQDSYMFPVSIKENLSCTSPSNTPPPEENLIKACKDAGILEFISSLPNGLDTVLSESAENLSGGQRQRIAIARAFLQDAPIVLFDEATSALDPVTEDEVLKSFRGLMKGRTAIMVAHRLKAIAACDTVIVMDKGRVAGVGRHEELLAGNKAYAALYESLSREEHEGSGTGE